jgi:hypothetical protein
MGILEKDLRDLSKPVKNGVVLQLKEGVTKLLGLIWNLII